MLPNLITVLAMMLGKLLGRLMRLQQFSNGLGRDARDRITSAKPTDPARTSAGFKTCTALFCAAPLGILGAVIKGLLFLLFIGIVVFIVAFVVLGASMRRRRPVR